MALAETAELAVRISLKDQLSAGLTKMNRKLGAFESGVGRSAGGVGKLGKSFAVAGLAAGGAAIVGLAGAAKAAIDFQDAFQGVVKTVDAADLASAGLTFTDLSDAIRKMSREMPNTAIELAGIAEQAGALGIKAKDIEAFTRQVAILASTTNVSAEDAATALGQLQNVIGLTGDEFDNFAASLVDLGNKGASTEADILEIARRSGAAAKLIGIAKEETLGWSAAAANLGLNSELAGTALQRFYLASLQGTKTGSKSLQLFAKIAGTSAAKFKKLFDKDAGKALQTFVKGLSKLPKEARLAVVNKLFGKSSGLTRLILGLADSVDNNLTPSLETSTTAWNDATAAAAEFEKRNATVKSSFARLKNNVIDAAVTIGEGFAPALGRAADKLSKFLAQDGNRSKLKKLGEDIGKAIDGIDFDRLLKTAEGLVSALRPAVGLITRIADAISKLPPELLGAGGALVVTNKITGGLVLQGLGDVVGGLGSSLAKSLAASIPLFGRAFVQPVFVTNMGAGGLGGGVPTGGGGLGGKVGAVAGAATKIVVPLAVGIAIAEAIKGASGQTDSQWQTRVEDNLKRLGGFGSTINDNVQRTTAEVAQAKNAITANERGEGAKHRAALAGIKAKEQEALVAFRAGERATQGVNSRLNTANARLAAIRAKRTNFRVNNTINISTRVSVSELQRQARYTSRVARSTSMSAS